MTTVIKLGGSLLENKQFARCLQVVVERALANTVLVIGGSVLAEQVRVLQTEWQFDDITAHRMAILAMQQTALLAKALQPHCALISRLDQFAAHFANNPMHVSIWSPDIQELNQANVPATWSITSDSLSAWLARQLQAKQLILLKSAIIQTQNLDELIAQGVIDSAFRKFTEKTCFHTQIIHVNDFLSTP